MPKPPEPVSLDHVPGAPEAGTVLCDVSELGPRDSKSFTFKEDHFRFEMFLQRWDDDVFAYKNSCPHVRLPLDFRPGKFLDFEKKHIHCANHGALFRVEDGYCVKGPCKGQFLTPVKVIRDGDKIIVA